MNIIIERSAYEYKVAFRTFTTAALQKKIQVVIPVVSPSSDPLNTKH